MKRLYQSAALLILFGVIVNISACSKNKGSKTVSGTSNSNSSGSVITTNSNTNNNNSNSNNNNNSDYRLCTNPLTLSSEARLADYMQTTVIDLEGDPTFCFNVYGYGESATAKVRIEYEDHYGISSYEMGESNVFYGEVTQTTSQKAFYVIFMDNTGFLRVRGETQSSNSSIVNVRMRYHNFPSYEDSIAEQLETFRQKCRDGTYTVAYCMGYTTWPSNFWWENELPLSPYDNAVKLARELMKDATKSFDLGSGTALTTETFKR